VNRAINRGFSSGLLTLALLALVAAVGTVWVSAEIVARDKWPIRWLELNGAFQRVSAERLRASLAPMADDSFFTMNVQGMREAALKIPWVASVRLQKQWPDTVTVHVREYIPLAHWNRGQLISNTGSAFAVPEADGIQGLPWLYGPADRLGQVLKHWSKFNDMLAVAGLEIRQLTLDRRGAWSLVLNNGTTVQLGREAELERLERLMSSWTSLMRGQQEPPRDVDLRYTNGIAVNWPSMEQNMAGNDS
jgi:cell division protein FtsQ